MRYWGHPHLAFATTNWPVKMGPESRRWDVAYDYRRFESILLRSSRLFRPLGGAQVLMRTNGSNHRHTVALADDHIGMIQKVSDLLADEFNVVARVQDGTKAVQAALDFNPDIFILDICMPGLDGIHAANEMKRLGVPAKIILLTVQEDSDYIEAARELGASYVLKSRMHRDLLMALEETLAGRTFFSRPSTQ